MIHAQVISKILQCGNMFFVHKYNITKEMFPESYREDFQFIVDFNNRYGKPPDKETFLEKFSDFPYVDSVKETDEYLINQLNKAVLYDKMLPKLKILAQKMQVDAQDAFSYYQTAMLGVKPITDQSFVNLDNYREVLYDSYKKMQTNKSDLIIPTGFDELDTIIGGIRSEAELVTLFARTGQSKSWILLKMLQTAYKMGKNVAIIEPEMDIETTGYRWQTLDAHFSNYSLMTGMSADGYEEYCKKQPENKNKILFASLRDFGHNCNVSAIRSFVQHHNIQFLGIDGVSYLSDERRQQNDNKTTQLTHIAEDLMQASQDLKLPIVVVTQANRGATALEGSPEIENIRDSDGLALNSTLVLSLKLKKNNLTIGVKKNRRGKMGEEVNYECNLDTGKFTYKPTVENEEKVKESRPVRKKVTAMSPEEVF